MKNNISKNLLLTAVTSALLLTSCSKEKSLEEHMSSASVAMQAQDYNSAILSLKNAIKMSPNNAEARVQLAIAYLSFGNLENAEKEFNKSFELGVDKAEYFPALAKLYMLLGQQDTVYDLVLNARHLDDEKYVQVLTYAGMAAISANEIEKAQDYINQAQTISENSVYTKLGVAWLDFSLESSNEVMGVLQEILAVDNNFSEALLLLGHVQHSRGMFVEAVDSYKKYTVLHPQQVQTQLYLINSLISAEQFDEADSRLAAISKGYVDHPIVNLYNSQVQYHKGNFSQAKFFAEKALQANNPLLMAHLMAGLSSFQLGEPEQAYSYLIKVKPFLPGNHDIAKVITLLQIRLGYVDDAEKSFEDMEIAGLNEIELFSSASLYFAKIGREKVAKGLLERARIAKPDDSGIGLQLGTMQLMQGDSQGIKAINALLDDPEYSSDANIVLATHHMNEGEFDKALKVADDWQETSSGNVKGRLLEGFVLLRMGKDNEAKEAFLDVVSKDEKNISALFFLGDMALKSKNFSEAKPYFMTILKVEPTQPQALRKLSLINVKLGSVDETISLIESILATNPENKSNLIVSLATNKSINNDNKGAIELLETSIPEKERSVVYQRALARFYLVDKKVKESEDTYKALVNKAPALLDNWLSLINLLDKQGKNTEALAVTNDAMGYHPSDSHLKLLKASLLIQLDKLAQAEKILKEFSLKTENLNVAKLYARVHLERGELQTAESLYNDIYRQQPTTTNVVKLSNILLAQDKVEAFEKLFDSHLVSYPQDLKGKAYYAQKLISLDTPKAKEQYIDLLHAKPNNVALLNNLAWVSKRLGEQSAALDYAGKAYKLAPSSTSVVDTYCQMLMDNGQASEAVEVIASTKRESNLLKLRLIEAHLLLQDTSSAKSVLNSIYGIEENLGQRYESLKKQLKIL